MPGRTEPGRAGEGLVTRYWWVVINPWGGVVKAALPTREEADRWAEMLYPTIGAEVRPVEMTYLDPSIYRPRTLE